MFVIYGCTVFEEGDEIILVLVCKRLMIGTKGSRKELKRVEFCFVFFLVKMFLRWDERKQKRSQKSQVLFCVFFSRFFFFFNIVDQN